MTRPRHGLALPLLLAGLAVLGTRPATGQVPGHSPGDWREVGTEHFRFVYPEELSGWALDMASRMEAVHEAVAAMVAFVPEDRVTVVVDDPRNASNGSMVPGPLLYVWPTPPNPRSMIGENRGWGEILAVHEFAHAAHLTRPSRNPGRRLLSSLIPVPVTHVMRTVPRWVTEGYATYIEGRLTGSGRPHGVWRPAVLRSWALEGQLPTYGQVSGSGGFHGGSMAYLVGSAYLEWLVEEGGDEAALPNLWRRLTARQKRSFDGAFTGVFGAPPAELYGRFTVDVTERALAVEDALDAAGGPVDGALFQRLTWHVGDPAVSPDGEHLAIRLTSRDGPSRLVVMRTRPDTLTTAARERYEEVFEADPEDVEPVQRRPRPQRPLATLLPTLGRAYTSPAWMPDGDGILVTRSDLVEGGRERPDLFLWRWETGQLRRITRGAAVREASPAPDGTWAVGVRCLHALCNVVRIELDDGAVTPLTDTDPLRPYYHPRVSPDGTTIVASVQTPEGWRLVAMDANGDSVRRIGPDDSADRFDAEFLPDGRLVLTSTRNGIHDLERLDPATGAVVPLTRVIGAAVAPAVASAPGEAANRPPRIDTTAFAPGDVFFLSLHSRGWDLRRLPIDAAPATPVVRNDPGRFPAATVPVEPGERFEAEALADPRPYGPGPRFRAILPTVHLAEDGHGGGLVLGSADPIGRLSWLIRAAYSTDDGPLGGSAAIRYRGSRPWVHVEAFLLHDALRVPSADRPAPDGSAWLPAYNGGEYYGVLADLELGAQRLGWSQAGRIGASVGHFDADGSTRRLAFGEYRLDLRQGPGHWRVEESIEASGAFGQTGSEGWSRWKVTGSLAFLGDGAGLSLHASTGGTDAPTRSVEAFALGGITPILHDPALFSQRIPVPALATSTLRGERFRAGRIELHGLLPVMPFFWIGDVDGGRQQRLAGARFDFDSPPVPLVRLPGIRFESGLARLLDGPEEGDWRAWLAIGLSP